MTATKYILNSLFSVFWGNQFEAQLEEPFDSPKEPSDKEPRITPPSQVEQSLKQSLLSSSSSSTTTTSSSTTSSPTLSLPTPASSSSAEGSAASTPSPLTPKRPRKTSGPVEEIVPLEAGSIQATLHVHPFTLKNMAMRYTKDLNWVIPFGGVDWTFFVHVISSDRSVNSSAMIGLKVRLPLPGEKLHSSARPSPTSSSRASLVMPDPEDDEEGDDHPTASALSSSSSFSSSEEIRASLSAPTSCLNLQAAFSLFEVSWRVISEGNDALIASSPPSIHSIEPGEEYIVEFANDELSFASCMQDGMRLEILISQASQGDGKEDKDSKAELS